MQSKYKLVKNSHFYYSSFVMKTFYQSNSQAHYKAHTHLKVNRKLSFAVIKQCFQMVPNSCNYK